MATKEYYEVRYKLYKKAYYDANRDKIDANRDKIKAKRDKIKAKINVRAKRHNDANRDKIKAKRDKNKLDFFRYVVYIIWTDDMTIPINQGYIGKTPIYDLKNRFAGHINKNKPDNDKPSNYNIQAIIKARGVSALKYRILHSGLSEIGSKAIEKGYRPSSYMGLNIQRGIGN